MAEDKKTESLKKQAAIVRAAARFVLTCFALANPNNHTGRDAVTEAEEALAVLETATPIDTVMEFIAEGEPK